MTMADDNSDSKITLSRRKALAGIGSIGLAGALGVGGTYAQFSDNEERTVTFTAGGIDGQLSWSGSYNGEHIDSDTSKVSLSTAEAYDTEDAEDMTANSGGQYGDNSIPIDVHFEDVKPGDYGCVNFSLTVANNPAWVASKLKVLENIDYKNFEPEIAADSNVTQTNVDATGAPTGITLDDGVPQGEAGEQGDLAQNIYTIPYYDSNDSCVFFDPSTDEFVTQDYDGATPGQFWSNSQPGADNDFSTQDIPADYQSIQDGEESYLAPRSLLDVSQNVRSIGTALWNSNSPSVGYYTAPNGSTVADGSVMLDGNVATDGDSGNNTQSVSPLQPGTTLNFGYDFHIPFGVGNEAQGDRTSVRLSFLFLQTRHTSAPDFGSYDPGQNTPNSS